MANSEAVLVTGGTGFVGMQIILQLFQKGCKVKTTVRSLDSKSKVIETLNTNGITSFDNLSFIQAELTKDTNWADAMQGCKYVLSVASPYFCKNQREGHKVYTAARRIDDMIDLKALGGFLIQMDITNEADIQKAVDTIIQKENKIDILWNNAGYGLYGAVEDVGIAEARNQFEVNVFGLASLTQKVIPFMRKVTSGTIINTSSMGGKMYTPLGAWYHASKHALEGWSDCLRLELKQFNIKVVILEPGLIESGFAGITTAQMVKNSGNGAYAKMVQAITKAGNSMKMSPGSVIAKTVSKIINTTNPNARYRVGKLAKPLVWMRVYLGDGLFDKMMLRQVK